MISTTTLHELENKTMECSMLNDCSCTQPGDAVDGAARYLIRHADLDRYEDDEPQNTSTNG